jgi:hypothetical protein
MNASHPARGSNAVARAGGRALVVTLIVVVAWCSGGCAVKRELVVISNPPGAQVRLDDQIVGWTPYTTTFEAYGTRRVTLYRDGYHTHSELVELVPPWYGRFPFDIFSEVLIPVGWHDRHEVQITLEPEGGEVTEPDLEACCATPRACGWERRKVR